MIHCPLCCHDEIIAYHQDKRRKYRQCERCQLVFVPAEYHLSPAEEKAVYDHHQNTYDDPGYQRFLSRLVEPLAQQVAPSSEGLDFGCGPTPVLARMMAQRGHKMDYYDLYYFPDTLLHKRSYDFITATEVIEHLANPYRVLPELFAALRPGGIIGFMTKLVLSQDRFAHWHYIRDPTHICFYSRPTFEWIAMAHNLTLEFVGSDVILMSSYK